MKCLKEKHIKYTKLQIAAKLFPLRGFDYMYVTIESILFLKKPKQLQYHLSGYLYQPLDYCKPI